MPRLFSSARPRVAFLCALAAPLSVHAAGPFTAGDILQEMRNFRETGSVLYVAAHPDDENNRLMPYLARGRALRTAYLSLTRGDGGQNLIGPELGDKLGVIRTQELLAARRIDGAQQFFTRARDFGFSKTPEEALAIWDRKEVLGDIVRVIRRFRPDVVITRFPIPPGSGGHGHHTASAILAVEAFKLAGDPLAYPEQLNEGLTVWQPKRIFWNSFNPANFGSDATPGVVRLEANGFDPLLGESFSEIGARGRSMHKSQGEGRTGARGGAIFDTFALIAGEPAAQDILDGVDTAWARFPGGAGIGPLADELVAQFSPRDPAASVPALLVVREKLGALDATDPRLAEKRRQLDRILAACLGLFVETTIPAAQVVPGEVLKLKHNVAVRTAFPVRWLGVSYAAAKTEPFAAPVELQTGEIATREASPMLSIETPLTQPYWLRETGTGGMFRVADSVLIGLAENPPVFPVEHTFEVGGQTLTMADEPIQLIVDPVRGEIRRRLEVIAPVALNWTSSLEVFAPGEAKTVALELTAARAGAAGTLRPEAPAGWQVAPIAQEFKLGGVGEKSRYNFTVTAPASPGAGRIGVRAEVGARGYHRSRAEINYEHIPAQLLQDDAPLKTVALDVAVKARRVGYLPGAGDDAPAALRQLGCTVVLLEGADLTPEKLAGLDAVVLGVRAFNTRADLVPRLPALWAWIESGGTVVAQYSRPTRDLKTDQPAPFPLKLSDLRVTDETAAMNLLAPGHPVFNAPNKITPADFDGWVQERGAYFASSWDGRFTPLLASHDPGEQPLSGGLLVAKHGKGYYVYTGLAFFRQLPAGVPGAYRLFANLISLGK
jgi:LmbE family N-acetylglucosaminyl deacetylase